MKKLFLDSCTKTAFSFDNALYEQWCADGVIPWTSISQYYSKRSKFRHSDKGALWVG